MSIFVVILILVAIGVGLYFLNKIRMDPTIKWIINAVVIAFVIIFLLKVFGIWGALMSARI